MKKILFFVLILMHFSCGFSQKSGGLIKSDPRVGTWDLITEDEYDYGPEYFEEGVGFRVIGIVEGDSDWMISLFYDDQDGFAALCLFKVKLKGNQVNGQISTSISTEEWVGKRFSFILGYDKEKNELLIEQNGRKFRFKRISKLDGN